MLALLRQHEMKSLAWAVNISIQICPFASDLDIGLVDPPQADCRPFAYLSLNSDLRYVAYNPSIQGCMTDRYAAFGQNFLKVTIGNRIVHIKEHSMQITLWETVHL